LLFAAGSIGAQVHGTNKTVRTLVTDGKATLDVPGCGTVVVNAGQSGYYRTLYAPQQFAALKSDFARLAPIAPPKFGVFRM